MERGISYGSAIAQGTAAPDSPGYGTCDDGSTPAKARANMDRGLVRSATSDRSVG